MRQSKRIRLTAAILALTALFIYVGFYFLVAAR